MKDPMPGENDTNFQFLAEHSVDIICRVGLDLVMNYASPSTFRVLGWRPEEMMGRVARDFILAEDMPLLAACGFSPIPITRSPLKPITDSPPIPISVLP